MAVGTQWILNTISLKEKTNQSPDLLPIRMQHIKTDTWAVLKNGSLYLSMTYIGTI